MLTDEQAKFLHDELMSAQNPLFIHDDDADGLCSYLLLFRKCGKGRGFILKTAPKLDMRLAAKIIELNPDKIFVLDVPIVEQEFLDAVMRPVFWIDHHQPLQREHVYYYNPRLTDVNAYVPTSRMAYQVTGGIEGNLKDLWIAMAGCLADWYMPDFAEEFAVRYTSYLAEKKDLTDALYHNQVGLLVKMFFFLLKGKSQDVHKSLKVLTRIENPDEIFKQESAQGKFLWKRFEDINKRYESLLKEAKKHVTKSKLLLFYYTEQQWSFTANLANELTATYPDKVVIIARNKSGEYKSSLRAQFPILPAIEKALVGVSGYGGGHQNACGAVIKEEDWERFLENFKRELKE